LTAVVKTVKVTDLIPLSREILCDDTLHEFHQVIRFDVIYGSPLRAQLLLDRRHKTQKSLSKPVAYFRMSRTEQLIRMGINSFTTALTLAFFNQGRKEPTRKEITDALESLWGMVKGDIELSTDVALNQIQLHVRARKTRMVLGSKKDV